MTDHYRAHEPGALERFALAILVGLAVIGLGLGALALAYFLLR